MLYRHAKKLHNEDEVTRKSDGRVLVVTSVEIDPDAKSVIVYCDDGNGYRHREIR